MESRAADAFQIGQHIEIVEAEDAVALAFEPG